MNILSTIIDIYRKWNTVIYAIQGKNDLHKLDLKQWFSNFSMHQVHLKWKSSHSVVSASATWKSPDQNTGVGSLSLLQGIFPIQGSNPDLLHCRRILYQLSHKGSQRIFLTNWAIREAPGSPRGLLKQSWAWSQSFWFSTLQESLTNKKYGTKSKTCWGKKNVPLLESHSKAF